MYLNKLKIASTKVICNIFIAIGAFFWFFAAMFVIFMITHVAEDRMVALAGGGFMTVMAGGLASVFTFPAVLLKGRIYRAEKYNRIFEEDYDGLVPYSAFEKLTGFTGQRVRSDIRVLTDKNILRNVTYGWEGKGGNETYTGAAFEKYLNVYPIPSTEVMANSNLIQIDGYTEIE